MTQEIEEKILGAIARGYCHDINSEKVLDAELCFAINEEVCKCLEEIMPELKTAETI